MALYLGSNKRKIRLNGEKHRLILPSVVPVEIKRLLSSDGYILQDSNGIYLITKDGE